MNEELTGPYRKLEAVQDQIEFNLLLDHYTAHYKMKFKGIPVRDTNDTYLIKEIKKLCGERAREVIQHFFCMTDDWYHKKGFSLQCLKENLPAVVSSYNKKSASQKHDGKVVRDFWCESCWKPITLYQELTKTDMNDKLYRCPKCETENKPHKIRSITQKQDTSKKLTSIVKDVPTKW